MKKNRKVSEILSEHFRKLQKENRRFSLRSLALKLEISHPFLNSILSGKKRLPVKRLDAICEALKIDEFDKKQIKKGLLLENSKSADLDLDISKTVQLKTTDLLPEGHLSILRYWWSLPMLELLSCFNETGLTKKQIMTRFEISPFEFDVSMNQLLQLKLVHSKDDYYLKTNVHLKFPTRGPNPLTKQFYKKSLSLAQEALEKTDQQAFEKRYISTVSCAVNPQNIPLAKEKLALALAEIRDILTDGECTDVYFLQAQLFSVLK